MTEETLGLDAFDSVAGAEEGALMEVTSPKTGEVMRWPDGRPWTITFYGGDSERVVSVARKQADRTSQQMMRTRAPLPIVVVEKDIVEQLVAATKTWDIPLSDGKPAPNDPKEYRAAYVKYKWLYEQGNLFVGTRANFLKA